LSIGNPKLFRLFCLACVYFVLSACASTSGLAPVDDQSRRLRDPVKPYRIVVAGDTLYSIAWEIGQDYRTVARWNNIRSPYLIRPGQRLKIKSGAKNVSREASQVKSYANYHKVVSGDTIYSLARTAGVSVKKLAAWNKIDPPYTIKPGQKLRISEPSGRSGKTRSSKTKRKPGRNSKKTSSSKTVVRSSVKSWGWPAKGKITRRFGQGRSKGLEISGKKGQPIFAAAAGKVVYQGSGLRGYGNLVIIKHNEEFLSAYAHCDRIVVKEGDVIKKGQRIATMGNTGTDTVKLHFEIRYRGRPVDPEKYLRRR